MEIRDPGKSPEELLLAAEERNAVAKAMNELPVEFREILTLRAIDDLSYTEIAEILHLREGTVKSRLSRARLALRNKLFNFPTRESGKNCCEYRANAPKDAIIDKDRSNVRGQTQAAPIR